MIVYRPRTADRFEFALVVIVQVIGIAGLVALIASAVFVMWTGAARAETRQTSCEGTLARSRECLSLGDSRLKAITMKAMLDSDAIAKRDGKAKACRMADELQKALEAQ
jgi:hypothetical protein